MSNKPKAEPRADRTIMKNSADNVTQDPSQQSLQRPSFCEAEPAALKRWLQDLPQENGGERAAWIHTAIVELNHCQLEARARYQLLEVIRPAIHSICDTMSMYLRKQPAVLPPTAYKVFQLTQQIQMELARGYEMLTEAPLTRRRYDISPSRSEKKHRDLLATALHRALDERVRCLFRCQLMYTDIGTDLWRPIHALYQQALQQGLQHCEFRDRVAGHTCPMSIEQCYLKALLLGGLHANQLRQEDLMQVFEYMPEWVMLTELATFGPADEDQLAIDLDSSNPPVFVSCIEAPENTGNWRLLVVDKLLFHLGELLSNDAHNTLSDNLVKHLLLSWGSDSPRIFLRLESDDTLSICLGLADVHFFSAGEVEYREFIDGTSGTAAAIRGELNQCSYDVRAVNVSQGGYGLEWPEHARKCINVGDTLGIRNSQQGNWGVGLVSWLRRRTGQSTQLGVRLLGQSVQPFGARLAGSMENTDRAACEYHRVLFLPAVLPINQPASLIAPVNLFREKAHLTLVQQGRQMDVRLTGVMSTTGFVDQFEVEVLSLPWAEPHADFNDLGDSLTADWPTL